MTNSIFDEITFKNLICNPESDVSKLTSKDYGMFRAFEKIEFNDIVLHSEEDYDKDVVFNECTFNKIEIDGSEFKEKLWFKNCIFKSEFTIHDGIVRNLIFINCEFLENLNIYNLEADVFSIDNCKSKNPIRIRGGIYKQITYNASDEKTHFTIDGLLTLIDYIKISTLIGATVSISNSMVNILHIMGDFNSSSRVNIKEIKNNEISIQHVNNDGKFYFTNFQVQYSRINQLLDPSHYIGLISDVEMKRELSDRLKYNPRIQSLTQLFNHISTNQETKNFIYSVFRTSIINVKRDQNPQLTIQYSSLGIIEFKQIELKKYKLLIITSDLSAIKLINTFFPVDQNAWTFSDGFSVFIDLYSSANKQNNISDKIEYYKAAQKYLFKKISSEKSSWPNIGSLVAIGISKIYSNHGSNWIQAAAITVFIVALPLYSLFLLSLDDIHIDLSKEGIRYFNEELLQHFPEFLNPLHRIDFMKDKGINIGNWSTLIDLLGRIFIGIGIFEMVRSFRKYVRS